MTKVECGDGSFCPQNSTKEDKCPAGSYCSTPSEKKECLSVGTYCEEGFTAPKLCSMGSYCPDTKTQVPCPEGSFCVEGMLEVENVLS